MLIISTSLACVSTQRTETPSNRALKAGWLMRRGRRLSRRVEGYHSRPVRVHGVSAYSGTTTSFYKAVPGGERERLPPRADPACRSRSSGEQRQPPNDAGVLQHSISFTFPAFPFVLLPSSVLLPPLTKQSRVESEAKRIARERRLARHFPHPCLGSGV